MLVKYKKIAFSESELMWVAARFFILERDTPTLKLRFCTGVVQSLSPTDRDMSQLEIFVFDALFQAMIHKTKLMQNFFNALYSELKSLAKIDPVQKQNDRFYEWVASNTDLRNTLISFYLNKKATVPFRIIGW